ncbi:MAG: alpha/beta hydrolase [Acinetobacter sp.]
MIHHVIVPGVGGSDANHWQSWLQRRLSSSSRVEQNWNAPILSQWVRRWASVVQNIHTPIEIIAHSFGCLTSIAALAQHPELASKVSKLILVAPANPARFNESGLAQGSEKNFRSYFESLKIQVPSLMIVSENDPWLAFDDAQHLAKLWNIPTVNLGQVGHINVASGFGPFPEILTYLNTDYEHSVNARMPRCTHVLSQ